MSNRQFSKGTWRIFVNCTAAIQFVKKDSLFISCLDFAWYCCYCLINSISVFQFGCYFSPIYHQGSSEYSVNFTFTLKILGLLLKRFLILQFFLTNEYFLTYVSKVFKIYWTGRILIFYKYAPEQWIALKARSDWLLHSELILCYSLKGNWRLKGHFFGIPSKRLR